MARMYWLSRRAFTLVEMIIALVITLVIVFAMVEAFRWVGDSTTDGRAVIEMLSQIRHANHRLQDDLQRCTVPLTLWNDASENAGYFELIEGNGDDNAPFRYFVRTPTGLSYGLFNAPDVLSNQAATLFGDLDDIVMCTIRNDDVPFRGRYTLPGNDNTFGTADDISTIVESNYAEVIWWLELNDQAEDDINGDGVINPPVDQNGDGIIDPDPTINPPEVGEDGYGTWNYGESFTIRRRVLLVRPDLNNALGYLIPTPPPLGNTNNPVTNFNQLMSLMSVIHAYNDISIRVHHNPPDPLLTPPTTRVVGIAANSLVDLTYRHNRTAHAPLDTLRTDPRGRLQGLSVGGFMSPIQTQYLPALVLPDQLGDDVVLTNVTGFDMRVWDPNAPVCGYIVDGGEPVEGIVPGDPQYNVQIFNGPAPNHPPFAGNVTGRGAFVDLGALFGLPALIASRTSTNGVDDDLDGAMDRADLDEIVRNPHFLGGMEFRSYLSLSNGFPIAGNFVYDPWTINYENDDRNQDAVLDALITNGAPPPYYAVDEGFDDLDNNYDFQENPRPMRGPDEAISYGSNEIDDDGDGNIDELDEDLLTERETFPPYAHPLKALQVRVRMYESDTRQVRQVSQTIKFGID